MAEPDDPAPLAGVDVPTVEAAVRAALVDGSARGLDVLGYGEISLVVGWPPGSPTLAYKRLPPFGSLEAARRYERLFDEYLDTLTGRGVVPVHSEFHLHRCDDEVIAYVVQPVLDGDVLGPRLLAGAEPDPDHPLITGVIEAVSNVCDERTGLDAQVSNWAMVDGGLRYLDVTTPMSFDDNGLPLMDMGVFLAAYPWALRGVIGRFVAPGVVGAYRRPRHVLVDLAANLIKERLRDWVPAVVEAVNRHLDEHVSVEEVERYYRSDARMWEVLSRLRSADRWWQRTVRRRTYPFLLPGRVER